MQSYRRYNRKNTIPSLVQMVPEHVQVKTERVRIVQKTLMQQEFLTIPYRHRLCMIPRTI